MLELAARKKEEAARRMTRRADTPRAAKKGTLAKPPEASLRTDPCPRKVNHDAVWKPHMAQVNHDAV